MPDSMQGVLLILTHFISRALFTGKSDCRHYTDGETDIAGRLVTFRVGYRWGKVWIHQLKPRSATP